MIFTIIISVVVDAHTLFYVFGEQLFSTTTVKITEQNTYIAQEVKEQFNVDYDISKIVYQQGFPDGYYLNIYNSNGEVQKVGRDVIGIDEIDRYFRQQKSDVPEHLKYLVLEVMIEVVIICILFLKYRKRVRGNRISK